LRLEFAAHTAPDGSLHWVSVFRVAIPVSTSATGGRPSRGGVCSCAELVLELGLDHDDLIQKSQQAIAAIKVGVFPYPIKPVVFSEFL